MADPSDLPSHATAAAAFESSLFTRGPVSTDPFYSPPSDSASAPPGTVLKLEPNANASLYTLPPATAISRLQYQSASLDGTPIPASAFILWPYLALTQPNGRHPIVAWAHGTTGLYPNCAPSHTKNLWLNFHAPFPLALAGYVTIAPDYAGLGVERTAQGKEIPHQFIANPAHANDIFYAVEAAQKAFPGQLTDEFVVMGHSQGGGAAWGAAQRQAENPVRGYLGSIAIAPVTDVLELPETDNPLIPLLGAFMTPGIQSLYPDFDPKTLFTDEGWTYWQTYASSGGCVPVAVNLLTGIASLMKPTWKDDPFVKKYITRTSNGGKRISGPLFVIQGEEDKNMAFSTTTAAVEKTMQTNPGARVEYLTLPGVGHTAALYASQRVWLRWIGERFAGGGVGREEEVGKGGLKRTRAEEGGRPRPVEEYAGEPNWVVREAEEGWMVV